MIVIKTRLTEEEVERLDSIIKKYDLKSRYRVLKYLIQCFLNVADQPENLEKANDEFKEIFDGYQSLSDDELYTRRG